jgi:hypothetical protein
MPIEPPRRPAAAIAAWIVVGAVAAPGVVLLALSLPWPLVHDAPIMHYVAQRIADGAVPYRDLFDMNQPGAHLVHGAVVRVFGDGDLAWRLFDLGWLALTCATLARLAWSWGTTAAAGAAALFGTYHLAGGAWQAGQRDFLLCVFLLGAATAIVPWLEQTPGSSWRPGLAGLLLGAGITLKPHAALFAGALGAMVFVVARRRRAVPRALALYAAGAGVAPLAVLAWLHARGGLGAWWNTVVSYLIPLYSRLHRPDDWGFWRVEVWLALGAAVALSLAAAVWYGRFAWRHTIAGLGLVYGVVHFVGQRKGWEYHLYPLAAFAAVLAFSEMEALLARRQVLFGGLVVVSLVTTGALVARRGHETVNAAWIRDKEALVRQLVDDLAARRKADDTIQVFDTTEGGVHALLRLHARQPTRFLYDFHFFHDVDHPTIQRLRAELMHDLTARPPRFVVVFDRGWPSGGPDRLRGFPTLSRFLEDGYRTAVRRPGYVVLERNERRRS